VDDLVTGMIMAAEAPGAVGGIYFLSDGMVYSNEDIANAIVQVLNTKALRLRIPKTVMNLLIGISERLSSEVSIINRDKLKELSHSHWVCDSGKAARELGFIPKVMIKEGMKWTVDWYRIHQWL
jgi:nucleoside-diphosphate-sugar epimerase